MASSRSWLELPRRRVTALALVILAIAQSAGATSICGTVRDAQTSGPVERAGVFLYDDGGTFTGLATATATDGTYCLDAVPAGTYTVVVRRDDFVIARVDGVVVDTATSIDIDASPPFFLAAPFPNPASHHVELRFRALAGEAITVEVLDLAGRRVTGWQGTASGLDHRLTFDLIDHRGRPLASGVYYARLRTSDDLLTRRFALIR